MKFLGFALAYAFLWCIALLPYRILFLFADLFFVLVYRVAGYRKAVVRQNLRHALPEKSDSETRLIESRFYHHFADGFLEWIYPMHRSAKRMNRFYRFKNPELLNELYDRQISVVGVLGHYGNWEWLSLLPSRVKHKVWAIHKPLKNRYFNKLINDLRSKYGVRMVSTKESFRRLKEEKDAGEVTMTYFLADQSPQRSKIKYWTKFLNQDTPVFLGPEQFAKKLDMAVVFFDIRKIKRWHYEIEFKLLAESPKEYPLTQITEMHVRALEDRIVEEPEWWLWSHRRWKHKRPAEVD